MPIRYRLAVLAGAIALFAAPAVADGYANKTYNRGPAPLKAHELTPPEPGCYLVDAETDTWSCPPLQQKAQTISSGHTAYAGGTVRRYIDDSKTRTYVNRYTTGGECCGDTRPAPPPRYAPPPPRRHNVVERGMRIDISGFGGGVGSGVDGGYYGGGGGFAYASASSSASASAMASAAASLTFRGGFKGGGKKGGGGCHVCGGGKGH
ncbi:MAG: hypothetical protein WA989_02470 [Henriciella sp.]|uniref:hypothetical protein n=1 Tax=Henriciella sp. TaxID=1968823 RepID=UPI003C72CF73